MAPSRWKKFKKRVAWTIRSALAGGPPLVVWAAGAPRFVPASFALLGFFLLLIPCRCRATNTDGTLCAENANGLLGACYRRAHKFQNAWRIVPLRRRPASVRPDLVVTRVRAVSQYGQPPAQPPDPGLWGSASAKVTTVGSLGSAVAVLVSIGAWLFPH
jgi:hypothetical protein